jgi:hypothetical protein
VKTQIGTAGGIRDLKNPVVGTASGNRPVSKIWVGTSGGNRLVWQRIPTLALTATPVAWNGIDLSWTDMGPGATYNVECNPSGMIVVGSTATSFQHRGLTGSRFYAYRVDAYIGGAKVAEAHANTTTPAQPAPQFEQRSWRGTAIEHASYTGSGQRRTDADGIASSYYGYWSGTHGIQKSQVRFAIPNEVRGCVSVDSVELRWWNKHHYSNTGGRVAIVGHTNIDLGVYRGDTGPLRVGGSPYYWPAPVGGWINGTEWFHMNEAFDTNGNPVRELIRSRGLQGFGLMAAVGGQGGYGYATAAEVELKILYTVRTG